jgi:hypothetical protein
MNVQVAMICALAEAVWTLGEQTEGAPDAALRKGSFASYLYFAARKCR